MVKKILLVLTILTLIGCNTTKPVVAKKSIPAKSRKGTVHVVKKPNVTVTNTQNKEQANATIEVIESTSKTMVTNDVIARYVFQYKDIAMSNMKNYGIPASIILAQGILESGAGKGDLAISANNHFGIKCHKDWIGESVKHDDDAAQECFRKYSEPGESFKDHAAFLTGKSRYSSLFQLEKGDYKAWARGLRKAGYATDPRYPDKLISYIERYNLHQYDSQVLGTNYTPITKQPILKQPVAIASIESKDMTLYEVQKGDTFYSISRKFNLLVDELKRINNLSENILSIGQKLRVK